MIKFMSGFVAELRVGWNKAATLNSWTLLLNETQGWDDWQLQGNIFTTKDFWFDNHDEFSLYIPVSGGEKHLKLYPCVKSNYSEESKNIILKGSGNPIYE